jgi:hypothetical protein
MQLVETPAVELGVDSALEEIVEEIVGEVVDVEVLVAEVIRARRRNGSL